MVEWDSDDDIDLVDKSKVAFAPEAVGTDKIRPSVRKTGFGTLGVDVENEEREVAFAPETVGTDKIRPAARKTGFGTLSQKTV